jgi:hypothetical protein
MGDAICEDVIQGGDRLKESGRGCFRMLGGGHPGNRRRVLAVRAGVLLEMRGESRIWATVGNPLLALSGRAYMEERH